MRWRHRLLAILQIAVITAIATAFARRVLGRWEPEFARTGERLLFESAFGLGMLGLLIFALGALQLFYLPAFLALLLVMCAVSWRALTAVMSEVLAGIGRLRGIRWGLESATAAILLAVIGILVLMRSLVPPVGDDWDSLAYHLAVPKLYLQHNGFYYVPFASHSNFPFGWEMLYTLGLSFGSVVLAKLFHFVAGALLVAAVYSAGRRHFSPRAGVLAALIVGGIPLVAWESTTAYVDLASALYSFIVIYALMNYSQTEDPKWAAFAGISAGFAAGTKMTALIMAPIAVVWILWPAGERHRPGIRLAAAVAVIAGVIAAPWYVKTLIITGNPVYPFFYDIFGGRNWSAETAALYRNDQLLFGMGRTLQDFLVLPWNLTFRFARFHDYAARLDRDVFELALVAGNVLIYLVSIGPVFLASLPVVILSSVRKGMHRPLLVTSLALVIVWFFMTQQSRYLLPVFAILAPAIAYTGGLINVRRAIFVVSAAGAIFTIVLMVSFAGPTAPVALGLTSRNDYLATSDIYRASEFVNENLPKDAKVALIGETRGFYLNREYMWADEGHHALIPARDPQARLRWLKSHGFDYVLLNRLNTPSQYADMLEDVYLYHGGSIGVYRIVR